jgi:hypothetical protein
MDAFRQGCEQGLTATDLIDSVEAPYLNKYDRFIPPDLLRHGFAESQLDWGEVQNFLQTLNLNASSPADKLNNNWV